MRSEYFIVPAPATIFKLHPHDRAIWNRMPIQEISKISHRLCIYLQRTLLREPQERTDELVMAENRNCTPDSIQVFLDFLNAINEMLKRLGPRAIRDRRVGLLPIL